MIKNTVVVSLNQRKTNALCDTGANVSCISKSFLDRAFPADKPKFVSSIFNSIKGVGGTIHNVSGAVKLDIAFGTLVVSHTLLVVEDLHHSLIIGHDFLDSHHCIVDIPAKLLRIGDLKVCSLKTDQGYARTLKPVYIQAFSEVTLPVKVARVSSGTEVLLEPQANLMKNNLMGAKSLVRVKKGKSGDKAC